LPPRHFFGFHLLSRHAAFDYQFHLVTE
jgi:hypothetical protein